MKESGSSGKGRLEAKNHKLLRKRERENSAWEMVSQVWHLDNEASRILLAEKKHVHAVAGALLLWGVLPSQYLSEMQLDNVRMANHVDRPVASTVLEL